MESERAGTESPAIDEKAKNPAGQPCCIGYWQVTMLPVKALSQFFIPMSAVLHHGVQDS